MSEEFRSCFKVIISERHSELGCDVLDKEQRCCVGGRRFDSVEEGNYAID